MRKRLTSILLTLAMLVGLLPALSPQAEASTGVAIVDVYSLADIKSAANQDQVRIIRLMKDIDASKENVTYDGDGFNTNSAIGRLASGCVLNGNGHTIYNLRGPLFANNMGNIHDLNVTLVNSDENSDIFAPGGYPLLSGIASWNDYRGVGGVIENCTVTMNVKRDFGDVGKNWLSIDGISLGGTIRNCIAKLNIDLKLDSNAYGGISVRGIGFGYNNSLTDHCLVLGSVKITSPQSSNADAYFTGISDGTTQDSACALDTLSITAKSARNDPYEHFTLGSGSEGTGTRNRAASDMNVNYTFNNRILLSGTPTTASGNYTLDTRPNILKDWDLSVLPDTEPTTTPDPEPEPKPTPEPEPTPTPEPEPAPTTPTETTDASDPFPEGDVWFRYSASGGGVKQHSFHYDSDYFNKNGAFQMPLAVASLCLEMAAFSDNLNLAWNSTQSNSAPARATNILELYGKLGFTNAKCVNYDVPLTDTSDKAAFSIAMKYIDNGKGGTDTLVAVPIRGGGYGGEWGSNFNVTYDWKYSQYIKHLGFDSAAQKAKTAVQEYLDSHDIKGDVKIWLVGYSRGAAVANLLGHYLAEETTSRGIRIQRENLYAYTFATPAGVSEKYMDDVDTNMFNFVSPVDVVPMVAPAQWGFGRYGQTIQITPNFSHAAWEKFRLLSGLTGTDAALQLSSSQQADLNLLMNWLCQIVPDSGNFYWSGLQKTLVNGIGQMESRNPAETAQENVEKAEDKALENVMKYALKAVQALTTKHPVGMLVTEGVKLTAKDIELYINGKLQSVARAHYPELYLTWLEMTSATTPEEFSHAAERKQLVIQEPYVNVRFWNKSSGVSAGSYVSGVCSSGEVEVEKTDLGLVATFPAGTDYSFTVSGTGASNSVSFTVFTYDNDSIGQFAAASQFTDLPLDGDRTYTVTVDEDPYEEPYAVDQSGKYYAPDDGTPRVNFTDVPESAYFYEPVLWAVENEITSGTSATKFSPYEGCTRGQVVTFLWRAAGCPEPESSYNPFSDVSSNAYYHDAVLWAAEEGITTGTSRTRFEPNATVTRAQTVTFLWRWAGSPEPGSAGSFRDVPYRAYYADAVAWAVEYGITNGTAPGLFSPAQTCTRAQIVTFLYRDLAAEWEDYET